VATVRAVLSLPDEQLDYARAKLTFDRIVDPSTDSAWVLRELDRMTDIARGLAGSSPGEGEKLTALRTLIYKSGPWNDHRPFSYDHSDPLGRHLPNKLLHNYIINRLGQCVSMPILFLILADRLGLNMTLANAPEHVFLRYTDASGAVLNLEATSGAYPARTEWLRQCFPMSDRALASGIYMRTLTRREAVACMAGTVVEHLAKAELYIDAIRVAEAILEQSPLDVGAILSRGAAFGHLIRIEFQAKYPKPYLIPLSLQPRYRMLEQRNLAAYEAAEALGWEEPE